MVTLGVIAAILLIAVILILLAAGGFLVGFGWILFIVGDIALAVWVIGKLIKKLFHKGGK